MVLYVFEKALAFFFLFAQSHTNQKSIFRSVERAESPSHMLSIRITFSIPTISARYEPKQVYPEKDTIDN